MDVVEVAEQEERNKAICDVHKVLKGTMKIFMEKSSNFSWHKILQCVTPCCPSWSSFRINRNKIHLSISENLDQTHLSPAIGRKKLEGIPPVLASTLLWKQKTYFNVYRRIMYFFFFSESNDGWMSSGTKGSSRCACDFLDFSRTAASSLEALIIRDFCAVSMGHITVFLDHLTEKESPLILAVKISLANSSSRGWKKLLNRQREIGFF